MQCLCFQIVGACLEGLERMRGLLLNPQVETYLRRVREADQQTKGEQFFFYFFLIENLFLCYIEKNIMKKIYKNSVSL